MPQMAPLNWSLLFLIFIGLFLISMILVYFLKSLPAPSDELKPSSYTPKNLNWKW